MLISMVTLFSIYCVEVIKCYELVSVLAFYIVYWFQPLSYQVASKYCHWSVPDSSIMMCPSWYICPVGILSQLVQHTLSAWCIIFWWDAPFFSMNSNVFLCPVLFPFFSNFIFLNLLIFSSSVLCFQFISKILRAQHRHPLTLGPNPFAPSPWGHYSLFISAGRF